MLTAIKALLSQDEDQAAESMELFDVLAECEVSNGGGHSNIPIIRKAFSTVTV